MKVTLTQTKKEMPDFSQLGFGKYFTDHMLVMNYANGEWQEMEIVPYEDFLIAPCSSVLHYGQGIFEGMKAYKNKNGDITMFRAFDNLKRMNKSAQRMCMPEIDVNAVMNGIKRLIQIDSDWIPTADGTSLYIRPFMIAFDNLIGVRPAHNYKFFVILSPVGSYYAGGQKPTKIMIEDTLVRASIGGTGEAKCMGNYAASLLAGEMANKKGYDQVLWLDAKDKKYIEEVGAMNIFFVIDNIVKTPALVGSILAGITRDSVLKVLKSKGIPCEETRISVDDIIQASKEGRLQEAFGCGTAAVISPVGVLGYKGQDLTINDNKTGPIATLLYDTITGIQNGKITDDFDWIVPIN